ncbi:MAG TPA: class I SAM-dependent methyltransferase [Flavisolibacter sp.]
MSVHVDHTNEQRAARAFTAQSPVFDAMYGSDPVIRYKRERVRAHVMTHVAPGSRILELNCGTGEDAIFFARHGYRVHATDISDGMLQQLQQKIDGNGVTGLTKEQCSFLQLQQLRDKGPYDAVFSNFGGLNCTGDLHAVVRSVDTLLKPGGTITLILISNFCLWELLLLFRGKFRTATRRFFASGGRSAQVEGRPFKCWYYSAKQVRRMLPGYDVLSTEGLCTLVPPSYIQGFAAKYPGLFSFLARAEKRLAGTWPWRYFGDYVMITSRKIEAPAAAPDL